MHTNMINKRLFWFIVLAAFVFLLKGYGIGRVISGGMGTDFRSFYTAALGFFGGGNIYDAKYLAEVAEEADISGRVFPYLYPPPLAMYMSPLTALGSAWTVRLWQLLSLALCLLILVQSINLTASLQRSTGIPRDALLSALALLLLAILPFDNNLGMGQVNVLVLTLIVCSLVQSLDRNHDFSAGFLLAAAALIKVTPVVFLVYFLINGRHRVFYGFAAGLAVLVAPSVIISGGPTQWGHFLGYLGSMSYGHTVSGVIPTSSLPNFSVAGCMARLLSRADAIALSTYLLLVLMGLALLWQHVRLIRKGNAELLILPYLIVMIVASPVAYLHHVVYAYPGVLIVAWMVFPNGNRRSCGLLAVVVGLTFIASIDFPLYYNALHLNWVILRSLNLYALLTLFFIGLFLPGAVQSGRRGERSRRSGPVIDD